MAQTAELSAAELDAVRAVVLDAFEERERPGNFSDEDWSHALGGWHVVVSQDGVPVSHAAVVRRLLEVGDRSVDTGYVEAVGTLTAHQRHGFGWLAMTEIDAIVRREFEMGALATGSHGFYERLGWERWEGPTLVRHGDDLVRSPEEDDAIMVLRFGASADVDLSAPIACPAREGDDW